MKYKIYFVALLALLLTSCAVTELGDNSGTFSPNVYANLQADVTVGEKITGQGSCVYLFGIIPLQLKSYDVSGVLSPSSPSYSLASFYSTMFGFKSGIAKGEATYNAIKDNNCDVIVDPVYEMETTNLFLFSTEKCIVRGYRGTVNSIEQVKD